MHLLLFLFPLVQDKDGEIFENEIIFFNFSYMHTTLSCIYLLRISYLVSSFHFLLTNFQKFFSNIRKLFSHSKSEQFSKQNTIYFMESFFTKSVLRLNQYIINLAGTIWFHSIPNESFEKFWSFLESYKEKPFKIIWKDIKIILTTFIEKKDIASTNVEIGYMHYDF